MRRMPKRITSWVMPPKEREAQLPIKNLYGKVDPTPHEAVKNMTRKRK